MYGKSVGCAGLADSGASLSSEWKQCCYETHGTAFVFSETDGDVDLLLVLLGFYVRYPWTAWEAVICAPAPYARLKSVGVVGRMSTAPEAPPAWTPPAHTASPVRPPGAWPVPGVGFGPQERLLAVLVFALLVRYMQPQQVVIAAWAVCVRVPDGLGMNENDRK